MELGTLDRSRLFANTLMIILVAMNIFFSFQYTQTAKKEEAKLSAETIKIEERLQTARFMKLFIDKVLGTNGTIAFDDRVKLEADVRELGDADIIAQWDRFVASADSEEAQKNAVLLMSLLSNKMI